jgi:hypothetical protein
MEARNIIKENMTINFGDKVWSSNEKFDNFPGAFVHVLSSDVVFNGTTGGIDMYSNFRKDGFDDRNDSCFAITVGDMKIHDAEGNRTTIAANGADAPHGHLVINGGEYSAVGCSCIYVANGLCEINGGTFFSQPSSSTAATSQAEIGKYGQYRHFLLNLYDSFGRRGDARIVVRGGSFIGFDPADNYAEGNGTNFVAEGYKSVEDGEFTYCVKDTNRSDNGTLVTVKVYTVVPSSDPREGIAGNVAI